MLQSQDVWSLFNETVRTMNDTANNQYQYYQTIQGLNATQAGSIDPTDTGAYNLTMYGMNTIHDIQSTIINPISQLKSLSDAVTQGQPSASTLPATTAHGSNAIGTLTTTAGNILPANNFLYAILFIVIGIIIGGLIFNKK